MTRKRFARLLMSAGMGRNSAQRLMDTAASLGLTHDAALRMLMHGCLAACWVYNAYHCCSAYLMCIDGRVHALRMEGTMPRVVTVMAPELQACVPECMQRRSPLVAARQNGKTRITMAKTLNHAALVALSNLIANGGEINA